MKVRFSCFQFNTKLTDKLIKHCAALFGHVGVVYILAATLSFSCKYIVARRKCIVLLVSFRKFALR